MSTASSPTDPFATWKQMFDQFEQAWSQPLNETLKSEAFASALGDTRERQLASQQALREGMETYLQQMRVPTKSDHAALAAQLVAIEAKIEAIEDYFDVVESKLDQILDRLESVKSAPAVAPAPASKPRRSR